MWKSPEVARPAGPATAAWLTHLDRCDQCNYDKFCMLCEGGFGAHELGMTDEQLDQMHSCNCGEGAGGTGFHLLVASYEERGWTRV